MHSIESMTVHSKQFITLIKRNCRVEPQSWVYILFCEGSWPSCSPVRCHWWSEMLFWPLDTVRSFHSTGRSQNPAALHMFLLACRQAGGPYRMRWAAVVGPRCRNQAQILTPGQWASLWA